MGKGFCLGWLNTIFAICVFTVTFISLPEGSIVVPRPLDFIIAVLHPFLGTGVFEEVLVRGLILKILLLKMGQTKKGIINACLISSAIFGIAHIVNIIVVGELLPVITQVVYATFIGVFYAALFLRTKTLWIPILFHGLTNVSTQIFSVLVSPEVMQNQAEPSVIETLLPVAIIFPFLIAGLILLRKVKPDESTQENRLAL